MLNFLVAITVRVLKNVKNVEKVKVPLAQIGHV